MKHTVTTILIFVTLSLTCLAKRSDVENESKKELVRSRDGKCKWKLSLRVTKSH